MSTVPAMAAPVLVGLFLSGHGCLRLWIHRGMTADYRLAGEMRLWISSMLSSSWVLLPPCKRKVLRETENTSSAGD